ncbi:hypothetical protein Tco_0369279 [Tanacetum coccineum]
MLERLAGNKFFCFLDGFSGYFQILIDPYDQEKTTSTYPYGTYAYKRIPFGLCNAPATFVICGFGVPQAITSKDDKHLREGVFADFYRFLQDFSDCEDSRARWFCLHSQDVSTIFSASFRNINISND